MAGYKAAVALKPDLVDAQLRLGSLHLSRGLPIEAATAFRAVATAAAGTPTGRIAEARALEASGTFDDALATMRTVVEAYPESSEAHAFLGRLLVSPVFRRKPPLTMNAPPRFRRTTAPPGAGSRSIRNSLATTAR